MNRPIIKPFITHCSLCKKEIRLLKDPQDNVYHGDCWQKLNKKIGEKK